jgi:spermidine/putrescine transport system substrate-binding protein
MRTLYWISAALAVTVLCAGCTSKSGAPAAAQKTVHIAIWSGYLTPEVQQDFEKKTGIKAVVSNYSSNEELLAKIQAGASGYDVVVPSDYMVGVMAKQKLLRELDRSKLPHAAKLDPKLLARAYDPENKYSVPFDWGTTGIAVNPSLYKGTITSWKDLLTRPDLAGKFTLLDDVRETLGAALRALGYSINTHKPDEIQAAKALLMQARKRVKAFSSEIVPSLTSGETPVAQAYGTDALRARKASGGKVDYVFPKEGCTLWIDNFSIPAAAAHPDEAHAFIDFMLNPGSSVQAVQEIFIAPSNLETRALLPEDFRKNLMLFPGPETMAKCEMIEDMGDDLKLWDRAWTEVKASE